MGNRVTGVTPDDIRAWINDDPKRTAVEAAVHFDVSVGTISMATNHRIGDTERAVYDSLVDLLDAYGWPPSNREIAKHVGRGISQVNLALTKLAYDGYIIKGTGARMLRLTDKVLK